MTIRKDGMNDLEELTKIKELDNNSPKRADNSKLTNDQKLMTSSNSKNNPR